MALLGHKSTTQSRLNTSSNIGRDKSFVDDLNKERGIVRMRVAFVPRSAEIQPLFWRFVTFIPLTLNNKPTPFPSLILLRIKYIKFPLIRFRVRGSDVDRLDARLGVPLVSIKWREPWRNSSIPWKSSSGASENSSEENLIVFLSRL
jgi:hypothetical protein